MKLSLEDFRAHIQSMWTKKQKQQLQLWIEHGLLIYTNFAELTQVWEEEYEDDFNLL